MVSMVGIALSRVLSTAITVVFSPDCVLDIVLPATTVVIVIILKEVSYGISSCYEFYKKKLFIAFCFRRILSMQIILFFAKSHKYEFYKRTYFKHFFLTMYIFLMSFWSKICLLADVNFQSISFYYKVNFHLFLN